MVIYIYKYVYTCIDKVGWHPLDRRQIAVKRRACGVPGRFSHHGNTFVPARQPLVI